MKKYKLYGWDVSPYTGKVRAYLKYKNIGFKEVPPTALTFYRTIQPNVGKMVMPVLETPEKEFIQDSTLILERLETTFPNKSIMPTSPVLNVVSLLVELFADEWLPSIELHYRWNYPENLPYLLKEFGKNAFPYLPTMIQKQLAKPMANKISRYLGSFGVTDNVKEDLESTAEELLSLLDIHFNQHKYLLGDHPTLGDFALYGPIYAHLDGDPYPKNLVSKYHALSAWLKRMNKEMVSSAGNLIKDDELPESLINLLQKMAQLQFPILKDTFAAVDKWADEEPSGTKLPQKLGHTYLTVGGSKEKRVNMTYPYWMLQRVLNYYGTLTTDDKKHVNELLETIGGKELIQSKLQHKVKLKRARLYLV